MNYLDLFSRFKSKEKKKKEEIDNICKLYKIKNYDLHHEDWSIDVDGDVKIVEIIREIPLKFRKVSGSFSIAHNGVRSLKNSPEFIGINFYCQSNYISTFDFFPSYIGNHFICDGNPIYEIYKLFHVSFANSKERANDKIELFNEFDIIRDGNTIILDRLNAFLAELNKPLVDSVKGYNCI